jgi:TRAP transporter TAXI family solute receptor
MKPCFGIGRFITASILAIGMLASASASAQEQWSLGTSSTGSGPYRWGATIAEVVNAAQKKLEIHPQATAGFNENLLLISDGSLSLALSEASTVAAAYQGLPPFGQTGKGLKNLRWVAGAIIGVGHCFARTDANVKTLKDVRGKAWNLNVKSTATRAINEALIKAAGLSDKDFKGFELSTGEVFGAIQNHIVAGSCNILALGAAPLQSLAASTSYQLIPVTGEIYDRFSDQMHHSIVQVTIPAGTYPGQKKDVSTFGLVTPIITNAKTDDDKIYTFTKAFWGNLAALHKNRAFKGLKLNKTMAFGAGIVPVHPGALRYYRETIGEPK